MSKVDLTLKLSHHSKIFRFCCPSFPFPYTDEKAGRPLQGQKNAYFRGVHWSGAFRVYTAGNSDQDAMTPLAERANAVIASRHSDWSI
jgi:hypothetical protein